MFGKTCPNRRAGSAASNPHPASPNCTRKNPTARTPSRPYRSTQRDETSEPVAKDLRSGFGPILHGSAVVVGQVHREQVAADHAGTVRNASANVAATVVQNQIPERGNCNR
jgi:hypothetical protein